MWSFAGATHRQITYGYHRKIKLDRSKIAGIVKQITQFGQQAVKQGQRIKEYF